MLSVSRYLLVIISVGKPRYLDTLIIFLLSSLCCKTATLKHSLQRPNDKLQSAAAFVPLG